MRRVVLCLFLFIIIATACGPGKGVSLPTQPADQVTSLPPDQTALAGSDASPSPATPTTSPTLLASAGPSPTVELFTPTATMGGSIQTGLSTGPLVIEGLQVLQLTGDPQVSASFYALTPAGLYITRDAGGTWAQVTPAPLFDDFVYSLAEPGILYAGVGADCYRGGPDQPLYESINGGATWSELSAGVNLRPVAVHPADPDRLWAIGCAGPAYSSDGGATWLTSSDDLFSLYDVRQIVPVGDDWSVVYAAGVSEGGSGVIARSLDGGETWKPLLQESPERPLWWINDLLVLPSPPLVGGSEGGAISHQLFLIDPHGVWRSQNGGDAWDFFNTGLDDVIYRDGADFATTGLNALVVEDETAPLTLYLGTAQGVYQSRDSGETWEKVRVDFAESVAVLDLALARVSSGDATVSPTQRLLFITTDEGVFGYAP